MSHLPKFSLIDLGRILGVGFRYVLKKVGWSFCPASVWAQAAIQVREAQNLLARHSHHVSAGTKMTCASIRACSLPESTGSPTTTGC